MKKIDLIEDEKQVPANCDDWGSRENTIDCPHMMTLMMYLHRNHSLPKFGRLNNTLRYHYTDAAGLLGIIENGRLWATDIRFLNDPSEGTFLPERLLELMASKENGIDATEKKIIEGIKKCLNNPRLDHNAHCVSLSFNGDLLSQWRGYGNFGKGFSVGLELGDHLPHVQIAQNYDVVYGDEGLMELAVDLLDLFVSASNKWGDLMYEEWASTISFIANSFKDASYSEEKESRLVCFMNNKQDNLFKTELPLKFRAKGSDLIPYIPMSLDTLKDGERPRLPIKRIVVGPGVDFNRNYASINALLKAHDYNDVEIVRSTIPFRP